MDVERLKKLAQEGDAQAALQLRERAKRTNDLEMGDFLRGVQAFHRKRLMQELEMWSMALIGIEPWVLLLLDVGPKLIQVIKAVRVGTARGLREAKALVDAARGCERGAHDAQKALPAIVMRSTSEEKIHVLAQQLQAVGATTEIVAAHQLDLVTGQRYYDDGWPTQEMLKARDERRVVT